jgi:signal transduction histidine kinase
VVETRVKDTGIGMTQETVNNLFKMFSFVERGAGAQKKGLITTQGVGLGLSANKKLLEKLGGSI